jgi:hypothetical protein
MAGMFNISSSAQGKFLGALKSAGPIIAGVAMAGAAAWMYFNNQVQDSIDKVKDYNRYAQDMADMLGYSYTSKGPMETSKGVDGKTSADFLASEMTMKNPNAAAAFKKIQAQEEAALKATGKSTGEIWGAAIAAGVDAKLHGATVQQAKDTARVALATMGKRFDDAQFEIEINGRVNFDDIDSMMRAKIVEWQILLNNALNPDHSWMEGQLNDNELFQASVESAKKAGLDFMQAFLNTDDKDKKAMLDKFSQQTDKFVNDAYAKAIKNDKNGDLKKNGVNNAYDFQKKILQTTAANSWMTKGFMSDDQFGNLRRQMQFLQVAAQEAAKAGGVAEDAIPGIQKFSDLFNQGAISEDWSAAAPGILDVSGAVNSVTGAADGAGKAVTAAANAIDYFKSVAGGAQVDTEKFDAALQTLGYNAGVTYDSIKEAYTNVYQNAQGKIFDEAARAFEDATQAALDASAQEGQNKMDALDKKADRISDKYDKKSKDLENRQKQEDKNLKKSQDARKKRETDMYDARLKAIDEAIKAEQKAEEMRQKIFEAEQTRIQRLSEMYNSNIDINMAINSGQMDEAAKLVSNAQAQQDAWNVSDAADASKTASDQRIEDLNKKKDAVSKEKDARMQAIDEIEQREKDALEAKQQREKDALKVQEDNAKKSIDAEKKAQQKTNENNQKALKKRLEDRKRELDDELTALRNHLPSTEAEMNKQMGQLKGLYDKYGKDVNMKSLSWAKTGAGYLTQQYEAERGKLASNVEWAKVGQDIAAAMLKGAFGMDAKQFAAWINGGTAPDNSLFGKNATGFVKSQSSKSTPRTGAKPGNYAGRANDPNMGSWHTGGIVHHGGGSGRVGKSGKYATPSEVQANLLVGEGVVSRKGMSVLGKAGLDYINSGGGIGGGGMGLAGAIGASAGAALGSQMIYATLAGSVRKRMGEIGNYTGSNSGVQGDWMGNALNNLGAIGSNVVYKSGKVVYLGHDGINRGGDYSGLVRPVSGPVASEFGPRNLLGMSFHNGIDIMAASGTPIRAAKGGRVIFTGWDNTGYGNYTEIQARDGSMYGYGHQSAINVRAGMNVATGSMIGRIGSTGKSTGPHLHFQIGNHGNWFNPRKVMPQLNTGGFIQSDGLAKLHKEEVVLTKPLTRDLKEGVQKLSDGGSVQYNVTLDFNGASFDRGIDFQREVETALRTIDRKQGGNRKIGGR